MFWCRVIISCNINIYHQILLANIHCLPLSREQRLCSVSLSLSWSDIVTWTTEVNILFTESVDQSWRHVANTKWQELEAENSNQISRQRLVSGVYWHGLKIRILTSSYIFLTVAVTSIIKFAIRVWANTVLPPQSQVINIRVFRSKTK